MREGYTRLELLKKLRNTAIIIVVIVVFGLLINALYA